MARTYPVSRLRETIVACQHARDRIVGQPYDTMASRELEAVDLLEDSAWAQLEPGAVPHTVEVGVFFSRRDHLRAHVS